MHIKAFSVPYQAPTNAASMSQSELTFRINTVGEL